MRIFILENGGQNMSSITLITCPHNEEKQLEGLIKNTRDVVDEIIVVAVQLNFAI